jgi:hypothetical protein
MGHPVAEMQTIHKRTNRQNPRALSYISDPLPMYAIECERVCSSRSHRQYLHMLFAYLMLSMVFFKLSLSFFAADLFGVCASQSSAWHDLVESEQKQSVITRAMIVIERAVESVIALVKLGLFTGSCRAGNGYCSRMTDAR